MVGLNLNKTWSLVWIDDYSRETISLRYNSLVSP